MKRTSLVCFTLFAAISLGIESQGDSVVYSQPYDGPNGPWSDGVSGQYYSTRVADNFVVTNPTDRKINQVTWWGCAEGMSCFDLSCFSAWVIRFYEDDGGLPGAEIYAETFPLEDTNYFWTGEVSSEGAKVYEQTVVLAAPPTVFIDEDYWISIGAIADPDPQGDAWRWSVNYVQGDDHSAADYFDDTGYHATFGDVAFVLTGTTATGCPRRGDPDGNGCLADIYPNNDDGYWSYSVDGDCVVDLADLAQLIGRYGITSGATREDGDIYPPGGDGQVDLADLAELVGRYGHDCRY